MLDQAVPHMHPEIEKYLRPPAPERGADALRAYAGLRVRLAGEMITQVATGEGGRVRDILHFYAGSSTSPEIEGVEALLARLATVEDTTRLKGVSAITPDRVLLAISDAGGRYLAHVLQPPIWVS